MTRPTGLGAKVAAAGACAAVVLAATVAPASATDHRLRLRFDDTSAAIGEPMPRFTNTGTRAVTIDVRRSGGGVVRRAASLPGNRSAANFPDRDGRRGAPRAVLRIRSDTGWDNLTPRWSRFQFGGDFRLDADSARSTSSGTDDGNNLVQRGLYDDNAQFKLEVDRDRVMCSVKGSAGRQTVASGVRVRTGQWYRARCTRDGTTVRLAVRALRRDGSPAAPSISERSGATGDLAFATRVPMSVGGKLTDSGAVASASDQFNGLVDNVFFNFG
jgi:hypothetical protein